MPFKVQWSTFSMPWNGLFHVFKGRDAIVSLLWDVWEIFIIPKIMILFWFLWTLVQYLLLFLFSEWKYMATYMPTIKSFYMSGLAIPEVIRNHGPGLLYHQVFKYSFACGGLSHVGTWIVFLIWCPCKQMHLESLFFSEWVT